MWIVRLALDRPYTFVVLALLILIVTPLSILRTPTDIFPNIDIPVIAVGWSYTGLNPEEMEGRITTVYERVLTTLVDNIEHIESTTYPGTTEEILLPILEGGGGKVGQDFFLGYAPERVDPGNKEYGIRNTPKLVAGVFVFIQEGSLRRTDSNRI